MYTVILTSQEASWTSWTLDLCLHPLGDMKMMSDEDRASSHDDAYVMRAMTVNVNRNAEEKLRSEDEGGYYDSTC